MSDEGTPAQWSATFGPIPQISDIDRIRMQLWADACLSALHKDGLDPFKVGDQVVNRFDSRFNKKEDGQ